MPDNEVKDSKNKSKRNQDNTIPNQPTQDDLWKMRIEPLIQKVDRTFQPEMFTIERKIIVIAITALCIAFGVAVVWIYFNASDLSSSLENTLFLINNQTYTYDQLIVAEQQYGFMTTLSISIFAVLLTLMTVWLSFFLKPSSRKDISDSFFRKHTTEVTVEDWRYFKALINMKCKEMTLTLEPTFRTNPDLFSQESLIRHLYD